MQQFATDFNKHIGSKRFDADAFMMVIKLGGHAFCKYSGSTNLTYRKGKGERLTYVAMHLAENPKGYNRLKLHYRPDETVDMEFYTVSDVPGLENVLVGEPALVKAIAVDYLGQAFEHVTGLNMSGTTTTDEENPFD
jgi:hypothetical protein